MRIVVGAVALLGLASCDLVLGPSVITTSALDPTIIIECRGDPALAAELCRVVGDELVEGAPNLRPGIARVVVDTTSRGPGRCAADYLDRAGRVIGTASIACVDR
jgi:hypothetical protein